MREKGLCQCRPRGLFLCMEIQSQKQLKYRTSLKDSCGTFGGICVDNCNITGAAENTGEAALRRGGTPYEKHVAKHRGSCAEADATAEGGMTEI